jgi:hypothetical protein
MSARAANLVFGGWLFVSAFVWPDTRPQFFNAILVSILVVILTPATGRARWPWYLTAGLGAWSVLSAVLLRRLRVVTYWNHGFVGLGLLLVAAVRLLRARRGPAAAHGVP